MSSSKSFGFTRPVFIQDRLKTAGFMFMKMILKHHFKAFNENEISRKREFLNFIQLNRKIFKIWNMTVC
jgi:hypothetical protein